MSEVFVKERILKSGKKVYEYAFEVASVGGKRKRKTKSGFVSKKEARAAGRLALSEYERSGESALDNTNISYALLMSEDGKAYRISMNSENGYISNIYLASGNYQVTEVSVYDDYKQEYPFEMAESSFSIGKNENRTLTFRLKDYEMVQKQIDNKIHRNVQLVGNVTTAESYYATGMSNVILKGTGELYYKVDHVGQGSGNMECAGNATGDYEVVVKIIKSGVLGEAQFQISLDGGKSYIGQDVVRESSKIADAGVTLHFDSDNDTDEFMEGDEFHVSLSENFPVVASKIGSANLIVKGHPMLDHEFVVTILSSGGPGNTRFTLNSVKGEELQVTDVIPQNGLYRLGDDISLVFSDSIDYEKDLTYSVSIRSNDDTTNYTPVIILFALIGVFGTVMITALSRKKETKGQYNVREYVWRKDEKEYE